MTDPISPTAETVDQAVADGGAYAVLRKRLSDQGQKLTAIASDLNARRLAEFGDSKMAIAGRMRIQSDHNAVGRDIVQVGDWLLFGYNVFLGLKTTTAIADVFSLYRLVQTADGYDVNPVDPSGTFLSDSAFERDFHELYAYYRQAKLVQLLVKDSKLLAAFQISEKQSDVRVFRWNLASTGEITYIDSRGERDIQLPPPFDFEWKRATKEMEVSGRFPHLNILDTLFVETTGGDLTLKVENNTETGQGIYSEPVDDRTQSLDDAQFEFAQIGTLILLKVLPYRESRWRGLVFNTVTRKAVRLDAIVQACVQLPEDHGIVFPGGYYLQGGEHKAFDAAMAGMAYKRSIRSPNGEDVLYVFYERASGRCGLLVYNLIKRELLPPIFAHGYARLPDGRMVLFHAENDDPTRVHQMQVWDTPFASDEFAAARKPSGTELGRIGNAELVRAVSDFYDLAREIAQEEVSATRYGKLATATRRLFDVHHWIDDDSTSGLASLLHEVSSTSESILDEFEKVQEIRRHSDTALVETTAQYRLLVASLQSAARTKTQDFVDTLNAISALRGHLLTIRDYRYIDTAAIDAMSESLAQAHDEVGAATGQFLADPKALAPLEQRLTELDDKAQKAGTATHLADHLKSMGAMSADLDMLSELMASLKVDDATQRTRVVEALSKLYARLNQAKARAEQRRKTLGSSEAVAQFGAQFALFSQSVSSALDMAQTPEKADEQLSRLMVQLEGLESQFGEHEQFLDDIVSKREELLEAFETHKQALIDARQRKAQSVSSAASRILEGLGRRAERFQTPDELNAFFVGDALIQKLRDLVARLRDLKDSVKADDIESRIKASRDQAIRGLRDRRDLFEQGGNVIKLGPRHRFSVNTQPLDLTLLPREDELALHLTGTDYMEALQDAGLDAFRDFWSVSLESESPDIYRAEYLAGQVLQAAIEGRDGLTLAGLRSAASDASELGKQVREFAAPRYRDGYEKGIHDHDATLFLQAIVPLHQGAGALIHPPVARALALDFLARLGHEQASAWVDRIRAARAIDALGPTSGVVEQATQALVAAIVQSMVNDARAFPFEDVRPTEAAAYLVGSVHGADPVFEVSAEAVALNQALCATLKDDHKAVFEAALNHLKPTPDAALSLIRQAMDALTACPEWTAHARFVSEASVIYLHGPGLRTAIHHAELSATVRGLLGQHSRIQAGTLDVSIDDAMARYRRHVDAFLPKYRQYQALRTKILHESRSAMRLEEFKARPLTSFVRNRLINEVYLPVIGDNLAKQMGTVGEGKRSDLMGLLMLISPPGYGKTTLMEYVASRLGLVFMKINGPALGHEVRSVDPAQAPDATSRQELEKLNLALEMGNNVMLYVDDIQHTHPEFLQKFISLCDGTRRIEGVWKGHTKTYDMRGKKFCVVMAGNPYTESGEVFKIPDMLANRADIYNLGDVIGGMEEAFLMSYIENSLTSNQVLAPLATREMSDLYLLMEKAAGQNVSTNGLQHAYSAAETNEIVAVLQRLMEVRAVVYRVNQQYIASAAQADKYRTEPPFKLQGSYRNMNKLAEKVSPAMNSAEIQQFISDHYLGESQLLTSGAEENLLKLAELRGALGESQAARWAQIKADFLRNKGMGGDQDVGGRLVAQLSDISDRIHALRTAGSPVEFDQKQAGCTADAERQRWGELISHLVKAVGRPVQVDLSPPHSSSLSLAEPVSPHAVPTVEIPDLLDGVLTRMEKGQAPLMSALRDTWSTQDLLLRALTTIMQNLNPAAARTGPLPSTPEGKVLGLDGEMRELTEFERVLVTLQFRSERRS